MKLSVSVLTISFSLILSACLNSRAPQKSTRSQGTYQGSDAEVGAIDESDFLGKSLDDNTISSLYEVENLRRLLGLEDDSDDNENNGDTQKGDGDGDDQKGDGDNDGDDGDGDQKGDNDGDNDGDNNGDNDGDKGDGDNPDQNDGDNDDSDDPDQNDDSCEAGKADCEEEDDELACVWNNPRDIDYESTIAGMPDGFMVSVKNDFIDRGKGRFEGEFGNRDYIVSFSLFHNQKDISIANRIQYFDQKNLWASYYTLIIKDYDTASCRAFASGRLDLRRNKGGCFAMGTEITMADGSKKPIAVLNAGEMIRNPVTGKSMEVESVVSGPEADKPMYTVGYEGKSVVVTQTHPFATKLGVRAAMHLKTGDKVLTADGSYKALDQVVKMKINPTQVVKNLTIKNAKTAIDHMVEADGVVTGDLYLQKQINNSLNAQK
jgi:hypothetical protein